MRDLKLKQIELWQFQNNCSTFTSTFEGFLESWEDSKIFNHYPLGAMFRCFHVVWFGEKIMAQKDSVSKTSVTIKYLALVGV